MVGKHFAGDFVAREYVLENAQVVRSASNEVCKHGQQTKRLVVVYLDILIADDVNHAKEVIDDVFDGNTQVGVRVFDVGIGGGFNEAERRTSNDDPFHQRQIQIRVKNYHVRLVLLVEILFRKVVPLSKVSSRLWVDEEDEKVIDTDDGGCGDHEFCDEVIHTVHLVEDLVEDRFHVLHRVVQHHNLFG